MSIHKSLRSSSGLTRARNVLSRTERVDRMTKEGTLQPGDSVLGLPKTKVLKAKKSKGKKKKEEGEEEETAETTEG
ncbi:MAG: small basic protein [Planctomycetes bacterium]|nr:small basic protein [Planctomycetota bacterium]